MQLGGDSAGRHAELGAEAAGVLAVDLVGDERLPIPLGQPGKRRHHRLAFLTFEQLLVDLLSYRQVGQPVLIAPLALLLLGQRGDQVAGGDDGIRPVHALVDSIPSPEDPSHRLLTRSSAVAESFTRGVTTRRTKEMSSGMSIPSSSAPRFGGVTAPMVGPYPAARQI